MEAIVQPAYHKHSLAWFAVAS